MVIQNSFIWKPFYPDRTLPRPKCSRGAVYTAHTLLRLCRVHYKYTATRWKLPFWSLHMAVLGILHVQYILHAATLYCWQWTCSIYCNPLHLYCTSVWVWPPDMCIQFPEYYYWTGVPKVPDKQGLTVRVIYKLLRITYKHRTPSPINIVQYIRQTVRNCTIMVCLVHKDLCEVFGHVLWYELNCI